MNTRRVEHQPAPRIAHTQQLASGRRVPAENATAAPIVLRPAVAEWEREEESDAALPVRIVVVDDHRFMREMISRMLGRQPERYHVVAEAPDATSAIAACEQHSPDLLILDINLPDISGIEAVPEIRKVSPSTRILLCTALVSDERVIDALRSGAQGFVEKTNSWDDFAEAVERVRRGENYFCTTSNGCTPEVRAASASRARPMPQVPLSPREREVLTLIAQGSTTKEIASHLGVSFGTVDTHRTNLMRKLKIRNVAGLVVYAFRAGLIDAPQ